MPVTYNHAIKGHRFLHLHPHNGGGYGLAVFMHQPDVQEGAGIPSVNVVPLRFGA